MIASRLSADRARGLRERERQGGEREMAIVLFAIGARPNGNGDNGG